MGEAGSTEESTFFLAKSVAGGRGVWAGECRGGATLLVLSGLVGLEGSMVTPARWNCKAGATVVRFCKPKKSGSVCKAKGGPESAWGRVPTQGRGVWACPHSFLRRVQ